MKSQDGWAAEGPKFAHVIKSPAPSGAHRYVVRVFVLGVWRTNAIFRWWAVAKAFAVLLDLSRCQSSTRYGSGRYTVQ